MFYSEICHITESKDALTAASLWLIQANRASTGVSHSVAYFVRPHSRNVKTVARDHVLPVDLMIISQM